MKLATRPRKERNFPIELGALVFSALLSWEISWLITSSKEISLSLALLASSIPNILFKANATRERRRREALWPEAIESVISALHSGKSITEAISDLEIFGPAALRQTWQRIGKKIKSGENLSRVLAFESELLQSARADQFFATVIYAKSYGGNSIQHSLRSMATFMRDDQQMLEEIETRFGWVKNSAALAAIAPWLLLLLLSAQPGTVSAFGSTSGKLILSMGVIATVLAYLWMGKISKLPESQRIFNLEVEKGSREGIYRKRNVKGNYGD